MEKINARKEAEKLKKAIQLTECISIDYEDRSEEEINELDDALDVIFGCARERLKELKRLKERSCENCKNYDIHTSDEMPCCKCSQLFNDYFEAKEAENG